MLFWFASQCLFIAVLSRSRSFGCTVCLVRNLLIIFMMRSSLYECRCIPLLCMLRFQVFFSRLGVHCIGSITLVGVLQKWQYPMALDCFADGDDVSMFSLADLEHTVLFRFCMLGRCRNGSFQRHLNASQDN